MFKEKGKINIAVLLPKVNGSLFVYVCISVLIVVFFAACSELEKPKPEEFYSETKPPRKQEFRWSNGKMPKSFDPALAAAAPETDIVRAIYDGLTETDPKTLKAIPAIAQEWKSSLCVQSSTFPATSKRTSHGTLATCSHCPSAPLAICAHHRCAAARRLAYRRRQARAWRLESTSTAHSRAW